MVPWHIHNFYEYGFNLTHDGTYLEYWTSGNPSRHPYTPKKKKEIDLFRGRPLCLQPDTHIRLCSPPGVLPASGE